MLGSPQRSVHRPTSKASPHKESARRYTHDIRKFASAHCLPPSGDGNHPGIGPTPGQQPNQHVEDSRIGNNICPASSSNAYRWKGYIRPDMRLAAADAQQPTFQQPELRAEAAPSGDESAVSAGVGDSLEANDGLQLFCAMGEPAWPGQQDPNNVALFLTLLDSDAEVPLTLRQAWHALVLADSTGMVLPPHAAHAIQKHVRATSFDQSQWPPSSVNVMLARHELPEVLTLLQNAELAPSSAWMSAALHVWLSQAARSRTLSVSRVQDLLNMLCLMFEPPRSAGGHTALGMPPGAVPSRGDVSSRDGGSRRSSGGGSSSWQSGMDPWRSASCRIPSPRDQSTGQTESHPSLHDHASGSSTSIAADGVSYPAAGQQHTALSSPSAAAGATGGWRSSSSPASSPSPSMHLYMHSADGSYAHADAGLSLSLSASPSASTPTGATSSPDSTSGNAHSPRRLSPSISTSPRDDEDYIPPSPHVPELPMCACEEEDATQCMQAWLDACVSALMETGAVASSHARMELYSMLACVSVAPSMGVVLRLFADAYPPTAPGPIATLLWLSAVSGVCLPQSMVSQELQLLEYSLLTLDPPPLQLHSSHGGAGHGSSRAGVRIDAHAHMLDESLPVVMAPRDAYLVVWVLRHYSFVPEQETAVEVLRPLLLSLLAPHHEYSPSQSAVVMRGLLSAFPSAMSALLAMAPTDLSPLLRGWDTLGASELLHLLEDLACAAKHSQQTQLLQARVAEAQGQLQAGSSSPGTSAAAGNHTGGPAAFPSAAASGLSGSSGPAAQPGSGSSSSMGVAGGVPAGGQRAAAAAAAAAGAISQLVHVAAYIVELPSWPMRVRSLCMEEVIASLASITTVLQCSLPLPASHLPGTGLHAHSGGFDAHDQPWHYAPATSIPTAPGLGGGVGGGGGALYLAQHVTDSWLQLVQPVLRQHVHNITAAWDVGRNAPACAAITTLQTSRMSSPATNDGNANDDVRKQEDSWSMSAGAMTRNLSALLAALRLLDGRRHQGSVRGVAWALQRLGARAAACHIPPREFGHVPSMLLSIEGIGWVKPPMEWLQAVLEYPSSAWFDDLEWEDAVKMLGCSELLLEQALMNELRSRHSVVGIERAAAGAGAAVKQEMAERGSSLRTMPAISGVGEAGTRCSGGSNDTEVGQDLALPDTDTDTEGAGQVGRLLAASASPIAVGGIAVNATSTQRSATAAAAVRPASAGVAAAAALRARVLVLFEQRLSHSVAHVPGGHGSSSIATHGAHDAGWGAVQQITGVWAGRGAVTDVEAAAAVLRVVRKRLDMSGETLRHVPPAFLAVRRLQAMCTRACEDEAQHAHAGGGGGLSGQVLASLQAGGQGQQAVVTQGSPHR